MRGACLSTALLLTVVITLEVTSPALAATPATRRVSLSSAGEGADDASYDAAVSADGRFVAFRSVASNLVGNDTNGVDDIFVRDRENHTVVRVSVSSAGEEGNAASYGPSISATGRFVAFSSVASNLVGNDTNGAYDVFVHDLKAHTTRRVSVSSAGVQGNGASNSASISATGRFVAFDSPATNLVGNDTNAASDVFVRDREKRTTRRVSVNSAGVQGNSGSFDASISGRGRFVAYASNATNLVGNDLNGQTDIFVRDRSGHSTKRVSTSSSGVEGNAASNRASISATGRFVAFDSQASNLVGNDTNGSYDVFVRDRENNTTRRVSVSSAGVPGNDGSFDASISADGRFVAFDSEASNFGANDTNGVDDVFIRDRRTDRTRRVSVSSAGVGGNAASNRASISADGRFVAFDSQASNLVGNDANGVSDIFIRGPLS